MDDAARTLSVELPLPVPTAYEYLWPEGADDPPPPGALVVVPLGSRETVGVVWGAGGGGVAPEKLKPVSRRLDVPPLPATLMRFVEWVAGYALASRGAVLRMAITAAPQGPPPPIRACRRVIDPPPYRKTVARARVLATLSDGAAMPVAALTRVAGVGDGVIRGLVAAGVLAWEDLPPPPAFPLPDLHRAGPALSPAQTAVAAAIVADCARARFRVTLLDGVTGAGKTEVYFEAVAATVAAGRQALVLVPEIVLTPQWLSRFAARFGVAPAVWHSDLARGVRARTWRAVAMGEARVVVGARSALFLPFTSLGLIVVDEEHEAAYKQEEGVAYNARDMAVVRAQLAGCPVVLASATPSLETIVNVERGRYARLVLPERFGVATLPEVEAIDLRAHPPPGAQAFLSPPLREALARTHGAGEQALLFLNRRGYAPLTLCRRCGHRFGCPSCSSWLVEHRLQRRLQCHHCGYAEPAPSLCPACGAATSLAACGPGVERIAEELAGVLPAASIAVMTSDTVRGPDAAAALVARIERHEIDVVIGTQMLAKGHNFPKLTLVGVVDGDLGLAGGDLRAAERTYQLLHQVAGRAGRAERGGRALLQTYDPDHPVIRALVDGDRARFYALEAEARRLGGWPPFGRLVAFVVSARTERHAAEYAVALARAAPRAEGIVVLGPAPAPLAVLRGRFRRRLLLKATRGANVQALVRAWIASVRRPSGVRLLIDVDPYSFL